MAWGTSWHERIYNITVYQETSGRQTSSVSSAFLFRSRQSGNIRRWILALHQVSCRQMAGICMLALARISNFSNLDTDCETRHCCESRHESRHQMPAASCAHRLALWGHCRGAHIRQQVAAHATLGRPLITSSSFGFFFRWCYEWKHYKKRKK